jgi:hypothetical protein
VYFGKLTTKALEAWLAPRPLEQPGAAWEARPPTRPQRICQARENVVQLRQLNKKHPHQTVSVG